MAGIALVIQLITGIFLSMHYTAHIDFAFNSVEHVMRDVWAGYGMRYIHSNCASIFFIVVYLHMYRGVYYASYAFPRVKTWYSGVALFLGIMASAFLGYVLPWGQMSFWGAMVITNLFSAVPFIGDNIVELLWGGFSIQNPTLNRFFTFHFLFPFVVAMLASLHLIFLHAAGSNNPLGVNTTGIAKISFLQYYGVKDFFAMGGFALLLIFVTVYTPNYMGHPDNYIPANPMVTPPHIVPEWYFLPFYAILRSIPSKTGGVFLMILAIIMLITMPYLDNSDFRSAYFRPFHLIIFWILAFIGVLLGWLGQKSVSYPFVEVASITTPLYFLYYFYLLPFSTWLENVWIEDITKY